MDGGLAISDSSLILLQSVIDVRSYKNNHSSKVRQTSTTDKSPTVGEVDRVLIIELDCFSVVSDGLLEVALLELLVTQVLKDGENNAS